MKYEKNTKTERNLKIIEMRREHPELSLEEIGQQFPVNDKPLSPQRVSQIIERHSRRLIKK